MFNHLITISKFNKIFDFIIKPLSFLTFLVFIFGLSSALVFSPSDYQQAELVRIMYIHVPSAWFSLSAYFLCALSGLSYLVWKNPLSAIFLKSLIPIGISFSLICLITGAIWGRPTWGVYWVWDARLTSVLILFFLFIGLRLLINSSDDKEKSYKATSILAIFGSVNLPIIKFSVDWWNTLHQPASLSKFEKPSLHPEILEPLLLMASFYLCLMLLIFLLKVKSELNSLVKR
ncbi:MAG: heme ABC transporter permease CcmC [Rickettsiales bacterium]|nr:heme ABC transporter permease CcmC [Rickettsiales bacterium]